MRRCSTFLAFGILLAAQLASRDAPAQEAPPPPLPAPPSAPLPSDAGGEPAVARAQPLSPSAGDADEMARMGDVLGHFGDLHQSYRLWGGIAGLTVAAAAIPSGAVMVSRQDGSAGWITLGAGIGAGIGGLVTLFLPIFNLERVRDGFEERRRAGKTAAQVVAETEEDWRERVESGRTGRRIAGGVAIALGATALATGTVVAVSNRVGDLTRSEQSGIGAALVVGGGACVAIGVAALFMEEPEEIAWEVWRRTKPGAVRIARIRGQVAALPGGGYAGLAMSW